MAEQEGRWQGRVLPCAVLAPTVLLERKQLIGKSQSKYYQLCERPFISVFFHLQVLNYPLSDMKNEPHSALGPVGFLTQSCQG